MSEVIIIIISVLYIFQCIIFTGILLTDLSDDSNKMIKTKRQAFYFLIPFGFLLYVYEWYNNLD